MAGVGVRGVPGGAQSKDLKLSLLAGLPGRDARGPSTPLRSAQDDRLWMGRCAEVRTCVLDKIYELINTLRRWRVSAIGRCRLGLRERGERVVRLGGPTPPGVAPPPRSTIAFARRTFRLP